LTNLGSAVGFSCKRKIKKGAKTSRGVTILERERLVLCKVSKANVGHDPNTLLQALKRQARNDDAQRAETEQGCKPLKSGAHDNLVSELRSYPGGSDARSAKASCEARSRAQKRA